MGVARVDEVPASSCTFWHGVEEVEVGGEDGVPGQLSRGVCRPLLQSRASTEQV